MLVPMSTIKLDIFVGYQLLRAVVVPSDVSACLSAHL